MANAIRVRTSTGWQDIALGASPSNGRAHEVYELRSSADTGVLGGAFQAIPGLQRSLVLAAGDVVLLDASVQMQTATGTAGQPEAFFAIQNPAGATAYRSPGGMIRNEGGLAATDKLQVPITDQYVALADGTHTFTVFVTNQTGGGGGYGIGVGGRSHFRITRLGGLFGGPSNSDIYGLRGHSMATGGGTVTVTNGRVKWSQRVITISQGVSQELCPDGHFSIDMPPVGTVIPGIGGASNDTVTTDGILVGGWQVLYYILPIGGLNPGVPGNFRLVSYGGGPVNIPSHWIPLAFKNDDTVLQRVIWFPEKRWVTDSIVIGESARKPGATRSAYSSGIAQGAPPNGTSGMGFIINAAGRYMLRSDNSGYKGVPGLVTLVMYMDGVQVDTASFYFNTAGQHQMVSPLIWFANLTAGLHYVYVNGGGMNADTADWNTLQWWPA